LIKSTEINQKTHPGDSALTLGIKSGRVQAVRLMLARGADANLADKEGLAALHHAVQSGSLELLSAVLRHSQRPLDLEARDARHGATPLVLAARQAGGNTQLLELLLVNKASTAAQDFEGERFCSFRETTLFLNMRTQHY